MRRAWLGVVLALLTCPAHAAAPEGARLWSVAEQRIVDPAAAIAAIKDAPVLILGEVHDNALHHRLQAWVVGEIAKAGRKPAVVWEMIRRDKAAALAAAPPDAAALGRALGWTEQGWPAWETYQPIAEAAFAAGLAMLPGDASRAEYRALGHAGLGSLAPAESARLALGTPLPAAAEAVLLDDMYTGHCELVPRDKLGVMVALQRFRDAQLADAALGAGPAGAILIAGNGHGRADYGVPRYLAARGSRFAVVLAIEGDESAIPKSATGQPVADYAWLTPAASREDPCIALRETMPRR